MKRTIIIIALAAIAFTTSAKVVVNNQDSTPIKVLNMHKPFLHTGFEVKSHTLTFSGLPKNKTDMFIIDAKGTIIRSGMLSKNNSVIDVTNLPEGQYTIALKQGANVKMFGYITDFVVTGVRP